MEALEFSEVIKTQAAQERRSATMEEIRLMGSTVYDIFIYNMYNKYSIRMYNTYIIIYYALYIYCILYILYYILYLISFIYYIICFILHV